MEARTEAQPKQVIIYHRADFDGIFCREIARRHLPGAEVIGWDYGDLIPPIHPMESVYMLDICIDELMRHPKLTWIDHHKTALDKWDAAGIPGYRIDGVAACRLAWQFFHQITPYLPEKVVFVERQVSEPLAVRLAGEYDVWDHHDPEAQMFQFGLRSVDLSEHDWNQLLTLNRTPTVAELEHLAATRAPFHVEDDGTMRPGIMFCLLENGRLLKRYQDQQDACMAKAGCFEVNFEGLKFLAMNASVRNSAAFATMIKPQHEGLLSFNWDGKRWNVSLFSVPGSDTDLSLIAKKFGGGGHRGACAFHVDFLPFLPNKPSAEGNAEFRSADPQMKTETDPPKTCGECKRPLTEDEERNILLAPGLVELPFCDECYDRLKDDPNYAD